MSTPTSLPEPAPVLNPTESQHLAKAMAALHEAIAQIGETERAILKAKHEDKTLWYDAYLLLESANALKARLEILG